MRFEFSYIFVVNFLIPPTKKIIFGRKEKELRESEDKPGCEKAI